MPEPQSRTEFWVVGRTAYDAPFLSGPIVARQEAVERAQMLRTGRDLDTGELLNHGVRLKKRRVTPWEDVQDGE